MSMNSEISFDHQPISTVHITTLDDDFIENVNSIDEIILDDSIENNKTDSNESYIDQALSESEIYLENDFSF